MLAAMSTAPDPPLTPRDGGDACPGALRLHSADDGALARVRVPGGVLTVGQAEALARAARELGDGVLHLTSRGNVQLRGLDADSGRGGASGPGGDSDHGGDSGVRLAGLLDAAGLLPSFAHERVRNVVASPLSGLDGHGAADVRPWLTGLDTLLCASATATALSGRFLFALDDGRGDVAALGADVTVRALPGGEARVTVGTSEVALRVPYEDAPRAALTAAEVFVEAARECDGRVWRVAELPLAPDALDALVRTAAERLAGRLTEGLTGRLAGRLAQRHAARLLEHRPTVGADRAPTMAPGPDLDPDPVPHSGPPAPGPHPHALSAHAPFGRLTPGQWRELTEAAREAGPGELRLTPWRGVVVPAPGIGAARAAALLTRLAATGLVTDPASPWPRVSACVGRPGCAKSLADVRADAERHLAQTPLHTHSLPVHWSGCERLCGHPPGDRTDVIAEGDGAYRVSVVRDGAASPGATPPFASPDSPNSPTTPDSPNPPNLPTTP